MAAPIGFRKHISSFSCLVFCILLTIGSPARAQIKEWRTGEALSKALLQKRSQLAEGVSLRAAVDGLQQETGIALILDRRIDPSSAQSLTTGLVTVRENIAQLARLAKAGMSVTEHLVVIAPPVAARRLKTVIALSEEHLTENKRTLAPTVTRAVSRPRVVPWNSGAEPRELFVSTARENGLTVDNAELIPHDIWAEAQLPALPFAVAAGLILNQFDLTFELTGPASIKLIPVPESPTITRNYRPPIRRRDQIKATWTRMFPSLPIKWTRAGATVSADVETHESLQAVIDGKPEPVTTNDSLKTRRVTLDLSQGVARGAIIQSLKQSKIPLTFEGIDQQKLNQLLSESVKLTVEEMPLDQFLDKVFDGTGARTSVTDTSVLVEFK